MDTDRIDLKTLGLCLIAILFIEIAGSQLVPGNHANAIGFIGAIRIIETVLVLWIIVKFGCGLQSVGIRIPGILNGFKKGTIWSAGFGGVVVIVSLLLQALGIHPLKLIGVVRPADDTHLFLLFCIGGVIGPVAEELFFRGLLYGYFRRWGVFIAILLSTAIFVIGHALTAQIPFPQIIGGILFAISYEIEKNLITPITIHIAGNLSIYSLSLLN